MAQALLEVTGLSKTFTLKPGLFGYRPAREHKAVDDVSFSVARGEAFGIVGESGCGKSTTARLVTRLLEPTGGSIRLDGQDLLALDADALRRQRRTMQMVFQDPFASLSPRMTIEQIVGEGVALHMPELDKRQRRERILEMLAEVGLTRARGVADVLTRYPHEFSGGQRQRIAIARALVLGPELVVLDEPTSALDVSVQAQVVDLLRDLQVRRGLAYLFISHDLRVVRALAHRIAVMKDGRFVEEGETEQVVSAPRAPYTRALMEAAFELRAETGTGT